MEVKKGYNQTDVGIIPNDWNLIRLGDIFDFKNGLNKEKKYFGEGTPIVNYMDVYENRGLVAKDILGKVTLTKTEIKTYEVQKDDVLFTRTSETVEEVGISSVILEEVKDTVFSGFVLRARPKNDLLDTFFKKYCFSIKEVRKEITSKSSYTTRALTNGKLLSEVRIPVPKSKAEQTAIANALNDVDTLISKLEELIGKKGNIKQGAMQELLTGKKRLVGFSGAWEARKLREVAEMSSGGTPLTSNNSYYGGQIPWVVIADMTRIKKYLFITEKNITELGLENCSTKLFKKGTLLFAMYASIGKCAIAKVDITCNQAILGINTKNIDTEFLYYYLAFNEQKFIQMGQSGTQNNLNKEIVQNLDIPYPPIEEQTSIAQILSDMDAEIEQLEQKLDKYRMIKQGMMQKLLTGKIRLL